MYKDGIRGIKMYKDGIRVVNPTETVVQLGLKLTSAGESLVNLTIYYTDVDMHLTSQALTTFTVPDFLGMWTRQNMFIGELNVYEPDSWLSDNARLWLAVRVAMNNVTLYYNCEEFSSVEVRRIPKKLVFDTASTLYIGQAGPLLARQYEVCKQFILHFPP
ncbi:collagen alpha-1(XV) chain [Caerostris darwini]|uniref:Collagen alpha-1(XV) chain n=1 Tax=Caerostris darwini TaxID=1538125 RepID=A0AAV4PKA5_9ARAC|nr:collagen alpha-1(XV) chain [Caerostris darwini]